MEHDIVYILRENINPEELRYSLRSLENLPHRNVVFVCGCPKGFRPDLWLRHEQVGVDKWSKIRSSMWKIIDCDEISDDFYLFNDDFFIMKEQKEAIRLMVEKTLTWRIDDLTSQGLGEKAYTKTLIKAREELRRLGYPTDNFEVHLPMLINKELMRKALPMATSPQMRSIYGNTCGLPHVNHKDVKVYDMDTVPSNPDFLSTSETVFAYGKVGAYIRSCFPYPSKYEV